MFQFQWPRLCLIISLLFLFIIPDMSKDNKEYCQIETKPSNKILLEGQLQQVQGGFVQPITYMILLCSSFVS
jgi:hypothetical protein